MKKKLLITVIALVCSVCCVAMLFAGCKDNKPGTQEYDISEIAKNGGAWYYKYELSFGIPKETSVDGGKDYASMNTADTYSRCFFSIKDKYRTSNYELLNIILKIKATKDCEKTITVSPGKDTNESNGFYSCSVNFTAGEEKEIVIPINKSIDEFVVFKTGLVEIFFHELVEVTDRGFLCDGKNYTMDKSNWDAAISIPEIKFTITKKIKN